MPTVVPVIIFAIFALIAAIAFILLRFRKRKTFVFCKNPVLRTHASHPRRKPVWVKRELIRIKAHIPEAGCRHVSDIFNRKFAAEKGMTVGKSYVHNIFRKHMAEVMQIHKRWKSRIPKPMLRNIAWGIDITGIINTEQKTQNILGIIDHGTRMCLSLCAIRDKASITLLKAVISAIETYGMPKAVRTDNEAVFTSRMFRWALRLLGIRHQRSMLCCPWQNGRIERFFGTFKFYADRVVFNAKFLQNALDEFAHWYNVVRPHRHLGGKTPNEAWNGIDPYVKVPKSCGKFSAWGGMLRGFRMDYG